jgi:hypothetical protein
MSLSVESSSFSGGGVAAAWAFPLGALRESVDQCPQLVQSFARDRRNRQHGSYKHGFELFQRADPFAARKLVDLGGHNGRVRRRLMDPGPGRAIVRQPWMPHIHQHESCRRTLEDDPHDRLEFGLAGVARFGGALAATPHAWGAGISVAREVEQIHRRAGAARNAIDVGEPRLAGSGARARHTLTDERVDQARLADVRAAHQRNLGQTVARKVACAYGASNEGGLDVHLEQGLGIEIPYPQSRLHQ